MSELSPEFAASAAGSEQVFKLSETFYSRTDARGVILAGNDVFQRVAGHDWDRLIGAPHKLIRHPDMPKGVFHLMWERIKQGKPTGAYIKNRRACGRFYWVFALVSPTGEGYISTRIKPTSPLRDAVEEQYAALLRREQDEGLTPAQSAAALETWVRDRGFGSYDTFQSHALASEFEARARQLGLPLDPMLKRFVDMSRAIAQVSDETGCMTEAFKSIRTVPMNMRIIASRLENAGGPISAISVNYSQMLEEMTAWVGKFIEGGDCVFAQIRDAILTGQFLAFSEAVEQEMMASFRKPGDSYPDSVDLARETAEVSGHATRFHEQTVTSLRAVQRGAQRFAGSVLDMKRYVTGLSSTRMMCKIESATLSSSGTALSGIVEQLDNCQDEIEARLARIEELNAVIQNNTAMLRSMM
ncbi:PAS domain-containing protein [Maliponia aquimaris]|uniref:Aerotaxis receptor n=1 Tax=Maliponia aquimaris TaxID=1673631 RepID=A0A238K7J0_9RHOB|nr:PAS domain-containing protein [Maliponia aquimaris]SMX38414.1 Aerotaxis receptor [Maliponia aquimaris]